MSCQMGYTRHVAWIRKHHDGANLIVFREHVLHEVEDGRVAIMTLFGELCRDPTVHFRHQVVDDDQVSRPGIE